MWLKTSHFARHLKSHTSKRAHSYPTSLSVFVAAHSRLSGKEEIQHGDDVHEPQSEAAGCGRRNHVVVRSGVERSVKLTYFDLRRNKIGWLVWIETSDVSVSEIHYKVLQIEKNNFNGICHI